jgi:hypothetical protein
MYISLVYERLLKVDPVAKGINPENGCSGSFRF